MNNICTKKSGDADILKYEVCLKSIWSTPYISPTKLLYVIWLMTSFEVVPIWLNKMLPMPFSLLKAVLVLVFGITFKAFVALVFNHLYIIKLLSFKWHFQSWKQLKVVGSYVRTVQRLTKLHNTMFCKILLHKVRRICRCVIIVKQSITVCPELWPFSYRIT